MGVNVAIAFAVDIARSTLRKVESVFSEPSRLQQRFRPRHTARGRCCSSFGKKRFGGGEKRPPSPPTHRTPRPPPPPKRASSIWHFILLYTRGDSYSALFPLSRSLSLSLFLSVSRS
jgi:hypothetical protein